MIIALQTLIFLREGLLTVLDRLLRPYYKKLALTFTRNGSDSDDDELEEQVFADFDDEKGVVFFPPVYAQRYAAVSDCLMDERWCGKLEKVVDLGYHDMSFIKYLKDLPGIRCILGVDMETIPLRCSSDLLGCEDYAPKRENPLQITLFQGNAADPDYRLIGCDAVVAIEMIEHMMPHDLDRLVHNVFGFIKPWVVIITTPNGDFNVLFKALESNGLRRLDHFFEWSRDQFHDWCSNIVIRYPQYSVSCKGIGPGPDGTQHYGCCSQLALFVNKEYHKQQDLDLNSLALVAKVPSPNNMTDLMGTWDSSTAVENNMLLPANAESMTDVLYSDKPSYATIVIASPAHSLQTPEYSDQTTQCNIEKENQRNFLMFDDEDTCVKVLVPRRRLDNKMYEIEDVNSRLNCSTFQVNTFSKTTQNLMAKNRTDSLMHTREVVDEIRHLTRMLNFNKETLTEREDGSRIWCNINWGDNAPYWNQYYKVVRDYKYPFETKSDECRILDAISEEMNRLIDNQYDDGVSSGVNNKLEIPLEQLMKAVRHLTDDVDKVRDLLEWNGYEVIDDVVIHTRLVVDTASVPSHEDDWPENDTLSDWDTTDVRSTTVSDGSTIVPDYLGRCLRRALDKKVQELRSMLSAEEDITTELDKVVCRLMKLALRGSKGKQSPPPAQWMQCKLLDLLTLTEKAICIRKKRFIESFPLKAIGFGPVRSEESVTLRNMRNDDNARKIMDKYGHLIKLTDQQKSYKAIDFGHYDDLRYGDDSTSIGSPLIDYDISDIRYTAHLMQPNLGSAFKTKPTANIESNLERTQAWVEEDKNLEVEKENNLELVPYRPDDKSAIISSSDHSTSNGVRYRCRKTYKKYNEYSRNADGFDTKPTKIPSNKVSVDRHHRYNKKHDDKPKRKTSKKNIIKKINNKSSSNSLVKLSKKKYVSSEYGNYGTKIRRRVREHKKLLPASNPIPGSIIELCKPTFLPPNIKENTYSLKDISHTLVPNLLDNNIASTEESLLVDIVMDGMEETIALRRTIGTDAETDPIITEHETVLGIVTNVSKESLYNKLQVPTAIHSQTIFLYDINEPSTSKGVRHVSMDVQCGPDTTTPAYAMISTAASLTRMPKMFTTGIKIEDSLNNLKLEQKQSEFGTFTNDNFGNFGPIFPRVKTQYSTSGIKIVNSLASIEKRSEFGTFTNDSIENFTPTGNKISPNVSATKTIKNKNSLANQTKKNYVNCGVSTNDDKLEKKSFDFGTCTNENEINYGQSLSGMKPYSLTREIKSGDTLVNLKTVNCSDFVTSMNVNNFDLICSRRSKSLIDTSISDFEPSESENITMTPRISSSEIIKANKINDALTYSKMKTCSFFRSFKNDNSSALGDEINRNLRNTSPREKSPKTLITGDLFTNIKTRKSSKFGTYANNSVKNSLTKMKSLGIKIKESEESFSKKVECATMTRVDVISDVQTPYLIPLHSASATKTKLIKPISSSIKNEGSSSELNGGGYSPKRSLYYTNSSKNTSDIQIEVQKNLMPLNSMPPKLSCGGVHIHSYREKHVSEDIMYQGEWQRNKVKHLSRKKNYNPVIAKKMTETINKKKRNNSKENLAIHKIEKKVEVKIEQKKIQIRSTKMSNMKKEIKVNKAEQIKKKSLPNNLMKGTIRPNKNVFKVASKITVSSLSSKNQKNTRILKRPLALPSGYTHKDGDERDSNVPKKYLPLYLRRRNILSNKKNLKQSLESVKAVIEINKEPEVNLPHVTRSYIEEIKTDLINFPEKTIDNITYTVFRNDIDNNSKSTTECQASDITKENIKKKSTLNNRSSSPVSQTSSACSTPDSIATVKAVSTRSIVFTQRHSASSNKSVLGNTESEIFSVSRNKKFTKRSKSAKKTEEKNHDNKENMPESSKRFVSNNKKTSKNDKSRFIGRSKNVFMAQFATESSPTDNSLSKHKTQTPNKSNIKIPIVDSEDEKKKSMSATVSKKKSLKSNSSLHDEDSKYSESIGAGLSNMILELEPHQGKNDALDNTSEMTEDEEVVGIVDSNLLTEWLEGFDRNRTESTESTILAAMRQIVEERLNFLASPSYHSQCFRFEMLDLSHESIRNENLVASSSLTSFKTVIINEDNLNGSLKSDIENMFNNSVDTKAVSEGDESNMSFIDTIPTATDLDLLSFQSVTSASRYSEYFLADNELSNTQESPEIASLNTPKESSVRDIFERKERPIQNPAAAVPVPALSTFSMNTEHVPGDQPDYVNLVDSETGSLALDLARPATSEEVFMSGRSSESFESCLIDDNGVVPNWLFHIISHSATDNEELPHPPLPFPLELAEPMLDANGNAVEPGAGAGDGRGVHSDRSRDSSGQGTSLSSSDASSSQQSESVSIDPSTFTGQLELLHEPMPRRIDSPEASFRNHEGADAESDSNSRDVFGRIRVNPLLASSDADADISSIDTDAPDSSDN